MKPNPSWVIWAMSCAHEFECRQNHLWVIKFCIDVSNIECVWCAIRQLNSNIFSYLNVRKNYCAGRWKWNISINWLNASHAVFGPILVGGWLVGHPTGLMCPIVRLELEIKWKSNWNDNVWIIRFDPKAKPLTRVNRQLVQFEWSEVRRQFCEELHFKQKELAEFPDTATKIEDCLRGMSDWF